MRDVIYFASISIDGFIESSDGDSSWVVPDPELHRHFNELERTVDTHLYGRRMYELMAEYWPVADADPAAPDYEIEYARIWKVMPKVVFSRTLARVEWNARLVAGDAIAEVAALKQLPGGAMSVGGTQLATALADAGLIDEFRFYVMPELIGSGVPIFSRLSKHISLKPIEIRQFSAGAVLLRYRRKEML